MKIFHRLLRRVSEKMGYELVVKEELTRIKDAIIIADTVMYSVEKFGSINRADIKYITNDGVFSVHVADPDIDNVIAVDFREIKHGYGV